jgi:hypothetical protein
VLQCKIRKSIGKSMGSTQAPSTSDSDRLSILENIRLSLRGGKSIVYVDLRDGGGHAYLDIGDDSAMSCSSVWRASYLLWCRGASVNGLFGRRIFEGALAFLTTSRAAAPLLAALVRRKAQITRIPMDLVTISEVGHMEYDLGQVQVSTTK